MLLAVNHCELIRWVSNVGWHMAVVIMRVVNIMFSLVILYFIWLSDYLTDLCCLSIRENRNILEKTDASHSRQYAAG